MRPVHPHWVPRDGVHMCMYTHTYAGSESVIYILNTQTHTSAPIATFVHLPKFMACCARSGQTTAATGTATFNSISPLSGPSRYSVGAALVYVCLSLLRNRNDISLRTHAPSTVPSTVARMSRAHRFACAEIVVRTWARAH